MNQQGIRAWAQNKISEDAARNTVWQKIESLYHLEYVRPKGTEQIEGYHEVIKPQPYKDILVAKNAYALARPKIKLDPWAEKLGGKRVANKREQALGWWFQKLNNRGGESVQASILESAFLYGVVCMQTSHTDYAARATSEKTGKRMRVVRQHSPYIWRVYNPMDVHWDTSQFGLERVLSVSVRRAQEVIDTWGKKADGLQKKLNANLNKDQTWKFKYVTEFYYCDHEQVYVWAVPTVTLTASDAGNEEGVEILFEENDLGFLNWVIEDSASMLERDPQYKHKPLLWYIATSGAWQTDCDLASLQMTKGIQNAAKPDWLYQEMGDNHPTMEYDQLAGGAIIYKPGQKPEETAPARFDVGLSELQRALGENQARTGVSEALSGNAGAETFAGQNQLINMGRSSIAQGIDVAQRTIAEGCLQNLQWGVKYGQPMRAKYTNGPDMGMDIELMPDELDLETTYISVELTTENEGTRIQQANVGAIGKQVGLSDETALEWMGIDNPEQEMDRRFTEEMDKAMLAMQIKQMNAALDLQIQQQQMEMQLSLQQSMAQPPAPQGPPPEMGGEAIYYNQQPMNPTPDIGYAIEGQGYNPAMGGMPPAMVNPTATYEGQTGGPRP